KNRDCSQRVTRTQDPVGSHSRINSPLFRVSRLDRAPPKLCQLVGQLSSVLSVAPHAANIS
ncbi:hypothetical protein ASPFODRAFT_214214, partial [Aspergillus luchuensis CBS 106.47]